MKWMELLSQSNKGPTVVITDAKTEFENQPFVLGIRAMKKADWSLQLVQHSHNFCKALLSFSKEGSK